MSRDMMLTMDEYLALRRLIDSERESEGSTLASEEKTKPKRRKSAYSRKYGKAFKKVAKKYKKKSGGWKANGFRNAQRAAHKLAKRMR
jgi:hypothetical protein